MWQRFKKLWNEPRCIAPPHVDMHGLHEDWKWLICECKKHKEFRETYFKTAEKKQ